MEINPEILDYLLRGFVAILLILLVYMFHKD
jgi:hypothetical protein